jgi:hypothetical protein
VGETVAEIAAREGVCAPATYVDVARPEDSPLHPTLEWDDRVGAEAWRVQQARQIINSVRCVDAEGTREDAPAFVHVVMAAPDDGQSEGYSLLTVALAEPGQRSYVLREALAALKGFRRRYQSLKELAPVWQALDAVERETN